MTPGSRVLISVFESKRGDDISHGLEETCHSWLLGSEGGRDRKNKRDQVDVLSPSDSQKSSEGPWSHHNFCQS